MADLPVACTLDPAALNTRRAGLLADVLRRADRRDLHASGIDLHFSAGADVLPLIARMIDAERQCCRFLRFEVLVEPDLGPILVRLSGPPGTGEFLADLLPDTGTRGAPST